MNIPLIFVIQNSCLVLLNIKVSALMKIGVIKLECNIWSSESIMISLLSELELTLCMDIAFV